jgi:hypothetical protein
MTEQGVYRSSTAAPGPPSGLGAGNEATMAVLDGLPHGQATQPVRGVRPRAQRCGLVGATLSAPCPVACFSGANMNCGR